VVVVLGIIARYGIDSLFTCTMLAGVLLVVMGITGLGAMVKYFPRPVVVGFTNGIAILIASTQIRDFFGLRMEHVPGDFFHCMGAIAQNFHSLNLAATGVGIASLAVMILCLRFFKKVPGAIVVCFGSTAAVSLLHSSVETIGTRFGGIPSGLPHVSIPQLQPSLLLHLLSPAVTVAMLGAIESLFSAAVSDRMSHDRHNPNVELVAQGVANIFSPLFGGLPATGAIARTATNVRSGAKTPVAGMIHALTVFVILFAAPLEKNLPLAALAGILFMVAYNMGDWGEFPEILRLTKADIAVWILTMSLTVFADLTIAVEVGMILAAFTFIRKISQTTTVSKVTDEYIEDGRAHILQDKDIPEYAAVYRIHGPFLFRVTDKISAITENLSEVPPVVIVRLRNMTAIDATGIAALEELVDQLHNSGRTMPVCGARPQPLALMEEAGFERHVGAKNICENIMEALKRAQAIHEESLATAGRQFPRHSVRAHFPQSIYQPERTLIIDQIVRGAVAGVKAPASRRASKCIAFTYTPRVLRRPVTIHE
jgi:sulfate permease, SulP family